MRLTTLRGDDRQRLTVHPADSIRSAMTRMNETGRTLLLVAEGESLVAVVADGDIRRFLASGGSTEDTVLSAANSRPTTHDYKSRVGEVRELMARRGLEYLPLVDGRRPVALCILERSPRSNGVDAVVMSGGLGSRLAPLTDSCPKPLLPLAGKPILSHILDHLRSQNVYHYVFSVNYLAHMIVDHYDDGSGWDCFIDYVHETQRLGTGGALSLVDLETLSDPFLCLNGDVLNDVDVGALREAHTANNWEATMVVRRHSHTVQYGVVDARPDGSFLGIREKPVESYDINAGVYMLSKSALDVVPREQFYDLPTLFADLQFAGRRAGTYRHTGRWIDIGTTAEYERAGAILSEEGRRERHD